MDLMIWRHESHHPRRRLRHAALSAHPHPAQTAAAGRRQADDRVRARQPRAHRRHRPHLRRHQRQVRRPLPAMGRRITAPHKAKLNFTIVNDGSTDDTNKLGAIGDIHFVLKTQNVDDDIIVVAGDNLFSEKLGGLRPVLPREERARAGASMTSAIWSRSRNTTPSPWTATGASPSSRRSRRTRPAR